MTAYIMVYLTSPFIELGLKMLDGKSQLLVFCCMTIMEGLSVPAGTNLGSSFFGLLYIYMLGRYMRINKIRIGTRKCMLLIISAILAMILLEEFINSFMGRKERMWFILYYNNPLIIIEAVSIFYIVKNFRSRNSKFINRLFAPCLCIYLIPEFFLPYKSIILIYEKSISMGIMVTVLFILCCLIAGHIIFFIAKQSTRTLSLLISPLLRANNQENQYESNCNSNSQLQ